MQVLTMLSTNPLLVCLAAFVAAGAYSWLVSQLLLSAFKGNRKDYEKDSLGKLVWDWLVFAPIITASLLVFWLDGRITAGLLSLGVVRSPLSLGWIGSPNLLPALVAFSLILSTIVGYGYVKRGKPKWLAKAPVSYGRAYLVDSVLTVAGGLLAVYLFEHWYVLHKFLLAGWQPFTFLNPDEMYGLRWAYIAIIIETVVVAIISLVPLLMYMRQNGRLYAALSVAGILFLGSYIFYLVPMYSSLLADTNQHFYSLAIERYNAFASQPLTDTAALAQIAAAQQLQLIERLPKGFSSLFVGLTSAVAVYDAVALAAKALLNVEINQAVVDNLRVWAINLPKRVRPSNLKRS